jgi:DNA replication protein DnaC
VLDDIGAHYRTNGVATDLFPLFDRRWRDGLPTIVTSNLDWPALKELIGERSADRLNDRCVAFELGGESFRKRLKVSP